MSDVLTPALSAFLASVKEAGWQLQTVNPGRTTPRLVLSRPRGDEPTYVGLFLARKVLRDAAKLAALRVEKTTDDVYGTRAWLSSVLDK